MYKRRFGKTSSEAGSSPGATTAGWRIPALSGFMLVIGLFIGYLSRPAIEARFTAQPTVAPDSGQTLEALRVELQAQTRHYLGSADAPVTLIEFGDFQ
jgi:hypothetical protein